VRVRVRRGECVRVCMSVFDCNNIWGGFVLFKEM
jgi:hypothetical protein